MSAGRFGPWTLTFLVVANMIGAGVFTTSGFTLDALGSPHWVLLAWIVGGAIALAGAASYGALSQVMPESGGEYLFLSRAAHPALGYLAGWVSLLAGFTGAIAFAAATFESYVSPKGSPLAALPNDLIAIGVVLLCALAHGVRVHLGAKAQNGIVSLKIACLAGLVLWALGPGAPESWAGVPEVDNPWPGWGAFAGALVWISLSYSGFNAAVYVAGESKDLQRHIPRALVLGTSLVTLFYITLNAIFVYAPPMSEVAGQPDVAAIAARWIGGPGAANLTRAVIALALLTSVSSMLMAGPRVYTKMAEDGFLPKRLISPKGTHRGGILLQSILAIVVLLISSLETLLGYLGLTLSLSAAGSAACLFLPKVRRRASIWLIVPGFYVGATVVSAILLALREPTQVVATALTFLAGGVAYVASSKGR